jgi:hypothetical protein
MDPETFIEILKSTVEESAISDTLNILKEPPGKKPKESLVRMSKWFNKLSENDKAMVEEVLGEGLQMNMFGLLCLLDGVRLVDNFHGKLELYFVQENVKVLLNDPNKEYLHDIYNQEQI